MTGPYSTEYIVTDSDIYWSNNTGVSKEIFAKHRQYMKEYFSQDIEEVVKLMTEDNLSKKAIRRLILGIMDKYK